MHLSQSIAQLLFLIMLRVVARLTRNQNKPVKLAVNELAMRSLPSGHLLKSCTFQISNQLANFARHNVVLSGVRVKRQPQLAGKHLGVGGAGRSKAETLKG